MFLHDNPFKCLQEIFKQNLKKLIESFPYVDTPIHIGASWHAKLHVKSEP